MSIEQSHRSAALRPGNLLNEESTPPRHRAAKGNATFLLNPISGYWIRLSTLPRDEIRDQCASRGEGDRRNKSTRETIPFRPGGGGVQEPKESRIEDGRVAGAPVSRFGSVPEPLMRYFIGHNPPFTGRPFVLEE